MSQILFVCFFCPCDIRQFEWYIRKIYAYGETMVEHFVPPNFELVGKFRFVINEYFLCDAGSHHQGLLSYAIVA